jgi:arsenite-transporting ATPase
LVFACHWQGKKSREIPMPDELLKALSAFRISHVNSFIWPSGKSNNPSSTYCFIAGNAYNYLSLFQFYAGLAASQMRVIFTMGKGGVGKTTIAAAIALGLTKRGKKVHLTTTDPAAHLQYVISETPGIRMSHIDEQKVLAQYKEKVLSKARETMANEDLAYIEEDLRSPCTQEIAIFSAFAAIVERSKDEIVIIDTAPTGHTLLLLDATERYHKEVAHSQGEIPDAVVKLLPRLRDPKYTDVVIVTLAEITPVHEATRLAQDLDRAGIQHKWWVINSSFAATNTSNWLLKTRARNEVHWINQIANISQHNFVVIKWYPEEIQSEMLSNFFNE